MLFLTVASQKSAKKYPRIGLDSAAISIFVVILVELTNTNIVFVNSTNLSTNIETAVLSRLGYTYLCQLTLL